MGPQSATFFYASLFDDDPAEPLAESMFSHEIAHSWWGGMVRLGDDISPWLNEGLLRVLVASLRVPPVARALRRTTLPHVLRDVPLLRHPRPGGAAVELPPSTTTAGSTSSPPTTRGPTSSGCCSGTSGTQAFFAGMRLYAATNTWMDSRKPVEVDDFKLAHETASGVDLSDFFNAWVFGTGYPTYRWAAEFGRDGERHTVRVRGGAGPGDRAGLRPAAGGDGVGRGRRASRGASASSSTAGSPTRPSPWTLEPRAVKVDGASWIFGAKEPVLVGDVDGSNDVDGVDLLYVAWSRGSVAMTGLRQLLPRRGLRSQRRGQRPRSRRRDGQASARRGWCHDAARPGSSTCALVAATALVGCGDNLCPAGGCASPDGGTGGPFVATSITFEPDDGAHTGAIWLEVDEARPPNKRLHPPRRRRRHRRLRGGRPAPLRHRARDLTGIAAGTALAGGEAEVLAAGAGNRQGGYLRRVAQPGRARDGARSRPASVIGTLSFVVNRPGHGEITLNPVRSLVIDAQAKPVNVAGWLGGTLTVK